MNITRRQATVFRTTAVIAAATPLRSARAA